MKINPDISDSLTRDERVIKRLRERIVRKHNPGDRIPPTRQLAAEFDTSHTTAQRAITRLADEGFLYSDGRRGTFIRHDPPHRSHYAVIYPVVRLDAKASNFWSAIQDAADARQGQSTRFQFHYDVEAHRAGEDYQRLLDDIETDRLAGLIFTYNPGMLAPSPLLSRRDIPRVGIMEPAADVAVPAVYPDRALFVERAMRHLASQGRKRLAVFSLPHGQSTPRHDEKILAAARRHGLEIRTEWFHYATAIHPEIARQTAILLMQLDVASRPDAILILDDHLAAPVAEGLIAAGVTTVGRGLGVVSLANFPLAAANPLHFDLLGFDAPAIFDACVERIDQQRTGITPPRATLIPPRFSFEPAVTAKILSHV